MAQRGIQRRKEEEEGGLFSPSFSFPDRRPISSISYFLFPPRFSSLHEDVDISCRYLFVTKSLKTQSPFLGFLKEETNTHRQALFFSLFCPKGMFCYSMCLSHRGGGKRASLVRK